MTMVAMPFLLWFDDNPKRTLSRKIADACQAYQTRYGLAPNVALISPDEGEIPVDALVSIQVRNTVRRNNVWVGRDE